MLHTSLGYGWSRAVLEGRIETHLHERTGWTITGFRHTLPAPQSELARHLLNDPSNFDFLTLHDRAVVRQVLVPLEWRHP